MRRPLFPCLKALTAHGVRGLRGAMPTLLRDLTGLAGGAMIAWGAHDIYPPLGLIIGGAELLIAALALAGASDPKAEA